MSKYYAVANGKITGIFTDWVTTEDQVKGFSGAKYKSFKTQQEAQEYLISNGILMNKIASISKPDSYDPTSRLSISSDNLVVYTDGSHQQGYGGIGILFLQYDRIIKEISQCMEEYPTTNIRAELFAIYTALSIIKTEYSDLNVKIYTDSEYSVNIFNDWIYTWMKNNWKTSTGNPPANSDLIFKD